jgi:hypothetical protein
VTLRIPVHSQRRRFMRNEEEKRFTADLKRCIEEEKNTHTMDRDAMKDPLVLLDRGKEKENQMEKKRANGLEKDGETSSRLVDLPQEPIDGSQRERVREKCNHGRCIDLSLSLSLSQESVGVCV